jgi:cell division septation protein DedD
VVIPRRVAFLGLAALILAVAGVAAAATYSDDDDTPAAIEQPATTTTSELPAVTTTTVAVTSTTAPPAPTTTVAGTTTTTRRGATTTSTRAGATTTTAPIADCTTGQIEARVTTDKPSYGIGEPVKIHSTLRNKSGTTCTYPSFIFSATILSPGGATITGFNRQSDAPSALGAGQADEAFVTWERVACTSDICPPNTPGDYTVSATWNFPGGPYTVTTKIALT